MSDKKKDLKGNFIFNIIKEDLKNKEINKIITRFPPEPNGYLHIGHAKSICLNFGLAEEFNGKCNLRLDDTNPLKEEESYISSIIEDIKWLSFDYEGRLHYASDYFEDMYNHAVTLIKEGKAYVCDLNADQIRKYRGALTIPGTDSPHRKRSIEENLDLFKKMREGEFNSGTKVLRAKIDMSSPNLNLRDPVMYRIIHAKHHRTGSKWCIYPTYDWAHGLEDSIENITHSICTLEFQDHRPLYDWFLQELKLHHPKQIEFARLNLTYTVMSKRRLLELVNEKKVTGWDDPRMPTISGLRKRGYTPDSIKEFCNRIGVAKANSTVDISLLEHCLREELNKNADRYMGVLRPLRVVIENYPENETEYLEAVNNPENPEPGTRKVPFSRVLYIEKNDFMENPPKKFYRLSPGREVRLRYAYFISCREAIKDENGHITELRCTYDPATRGGSSPDGRKVKATIHWVSAEQAVKAEVRLYDYLFSEKYPENRKDVTDWKEYINPASLEVLKNARVEPALKNLGQGDKVQFERLGYFCADFHDYRRDNLVFNRITTLRDPWKNLQKRI